LVDQLVGSLFAKRKMGKNLGMDVPNSFLSFFVACLLASLKRKKARKKTTFLWLFFQRRQLPLLV